MRRPLDIVRAIAACVVLAGGIGLAHAQSSAEPSSRYPVRPVHLIVPYAAGGSTDTIARMLGQKLAEAWGQPVIVENRPGASTVIGADALAKAPPDGHTLMVMSVDHVITPNLVPTPYDPIRDFAPVGGLSRGGLAMVLNAGVPADTLQAFVAYARSKPGVLNYGSPATGGVQHLAAEMLSSLAGLQMQHVAYKGGGPVVTDLVGGQVQLYFTPPVTVLSYIKAGRLKAVAISGDARAEALPDVPTFAEAGMPAFDVTTWFGVAAPAATPRPLIDRISADVARIVATNDMKDRIVALGMSPYVATPDQFGALMRGEMAKFADLIRRANVKLAQ